MQNALEKCLFIYYCSLTLKFFFYYCLEIFIINVYDLFYISYELYIIIKLKKSQNGKKDFVKGVCEGLTLKFFWMKTQLF